tara:strand:- start:2032 stop:2733 length:702 start_codon:yes stop_codon:yes gene_type:complete
MASKILDTSLGPNTSNDSAIASRDSRGSNTVALAQSTSSRRPTFKSYGENAKLKEVISSTYYDGSDGLDLGSSEVINPSTAHTVICCWVDGDYTAEGIIIASGTNGAKYSIAAGGAGITIKPGSARASAATYAINSTAGSTTNYTFGSDVELLIIVNDGSNGVKAYNINGDLILNTGVVASLSSQFKVDYLFHDGSGGSGFKGEVMWIEVYDDWGCTEGAADGYGLMFNDFKN